MEIGTSPPVRQAEAPAAPSTASLQSDKPRADEERAGEKRKRHDRDEGSRRGGFKGRSDKKNDRYNGPKGKGKKGKVYDGSIDGKRARIDAAREAAAKRPDQTAAIHVTEFSKEEIAAEDRKPKRKVAVMIGYAGTGYFGMQFNHDRKTIEGDLFQAFVKAGAISKANADDPKKVSFVRCARTDKGVHAAGNVISLKLVIEDPDIVTKINEHLAPQIRVWGLQQATKSFSAYNMVDSRIYEYLIPTHCFLPPHPKTFLARKLAEYAAEVNDTENWQQRQHDVAGFWDDAHEKYVEPALARIDPDLRQSAWEQLFEHEEAPNEDEDEVDDGDEATGTGKAAGGAAEEEATPQPVQAAPKGPKPVSALEEAQRKIKAAMLEAKKAWRITPERLSQVKAALAKYEGVRNYHNYTPRMAPNDPAAKRVIKSFVVNGDPFVINDVEWLSLKVHGQSFMMHQIRKMIGMAALVVRCGTHDDRMRETMGTDRVSIPRSPGIGLLLERPIFDNYNKKLDAQGNNSGRDGISFEPYEKEIQEFKQREIYDRIHREEAQQNQFNQLFWSVDCLRRPQYLFLSSKGLSAIEKEIR